MADDKTAAEQAAEAQAQLEELLHEFFPRNWIAIREEFRHIAASPSEQTVFQRGVVMGVRRYDAAVRGVVPDRETLAQALDHHRLGERLGVGLYCECGGWEASSDKVLVSWGQHAADALLASGVLGVPADQEADHA